MTEATRRHYRSSCGQIYSLRCVVAAGRVLDAIQLALSDHTTGTQVHDARCSLAVDVGGQSLSRGYRLTRLTDHRLLSAAGASTSALSAAVLLGRQMTLLVNTLTTAPRAHYFLRSILLQTTGHRPLPYTIHVSAVLSSLPSAILSIVCSLR